jgi:hypothetical protein
MICSLNEWSIAELKADSVLNRIRNVFNMKALLT